MIDRTLCASFALLWLSVSACRPGEGEHCLCSKDCRGGLVCAIDGRQVIERGCISEDLNSGICIEQADARETGEDFDRPPLPDDMTKRDFAPASNLDDSDSGVDPTVGSETSVELGSSGSGSGSETAGLPATTSSGSDTSLEASTGDVSSGATGASSGEASSASEGSTSEALEASTSGASSTS